MNLRTQMVRNCEDVQMPHRNEPARNALECGSSSYRFPPGDSFGNSARNRKSGSCCYRTPKRAAPAVSRAHSTIGVKTCHRSENLP